MPTDELNNIKVGTFVNGVYEGSQRGAMQFICAYRSGSAAWFLGTDYTIGTPKYNTNYNIKSINNDSLNWSDACACTWTIYLYLKSGTIEVENCKIPNLSEVNMINIYIRATGFLYWLSDKYDDSKSYAISELGYVGYSNKLYVDNGVVPLAKINI